MNTLSFRCICMLALSLFIGLATMQADEKSPPTSPLEFYKRKVDENVTDVFVKSFLGESVPIELLAEKSSYSSDEKLQRIWDGNVPRIDLKIPEVHLQFSKSKSTDLSFSLDLEFRKDALFVRHSKSRDPRMKGGVLFPWEREGGFQGYIPALVPGGVNVFFAPKSEHYDDAARPVMICLAKPVQQIKSRRQLFYRGEEASLASFLMNAEAEVEISLLSGHGDGALKAEYFVSKGIAPPYVAFDEAIARDPELTLAYRPKVERNYSTAVRDEESHVSAGLAARSTFQNAAGYGRTVDAYTFMHLQKVSVPSEYPFKKNGEFLFFQHAPCWAMYLSRGTSSYYSHTSGSEGES